MATPRLFGPNNCAPESSQTPISNSPSAKIPFCESGHFHFHTHTCMPTGELACGLKGELTHITVSPRLKNTKTSALGYFFIKYTK